MTAGRDQQVREQQLAALAVRLRAWPAARLDRGHAWSCKSGAAPRCAGLPRGASLARRAPR